MMLIREVVNSLGEDSNDPVDNTPGTSGNDSPPKPKSRSLAKARARVLAARRANKEKTVSGIPLDDPWLNECGA